MEVLVAQAGHVFPVVGDGAIGQQVAFFHHVVITGRVLVRLGEVGRGAQALENKAGARVAHLPDAVAFEHLQIEIRPVAAREGLARIGVLVVAVGDQEEAQGFQVGRHARQHCDEVFEVRVARRVHVGHENTGIEGFGVIPAVGALIPGRTR